MESSGIRVTELVQSALGEAVALLLQDRLISELRLNSDGILWVNKLGCGKFATEHRVSPENAKRAIEAVAYSVGQCCNGDNPTIAAELPGTGERFQGILPPLSKGPVIIIRKKAVRIFTLEDLVAQGVLSQRQKMGLQEAIINKKNVLIVGGTDTGKTTFANALLDVVSKTKDRVLIIEDTQELQCMAEDVEYLRTKDRIATLRDMVRVSMRLSPDRIVIGEVRGAEALDLIKAWNTGHGGGVSTVHASSARQGLSRIEQLVQEAGVTPSKAMIADAINMIVYLEKRGPKRVVQQVMYVGGITESNYDLREI